MLCRPLELLFSLFDLWFPSIRYRIPSRNQNTFFVSILVENWIVHRVLPELFGCLSF